MTTTDQGAPVEVAYRFIGKPWKRRTFKNDDAYEAWFDKNEDNVAEVRFGTWGDQ